LTMIAEVIVAEVAVIVADSGPTKDFRVKK
jgi:hypothetical protein